VRLNLLVQVYEAPLVASLAFSASLWAEPSLSINKKFVPEQVHVSQDMTSSWRESSAMDLDDQELGSRAQKEPGAYGVNVTALFCKVCWIDTAWIAGALSSCSSLLAQPFCARCGPCTSLILLRWMEDKDENDESKYCLVKTICTSAWSTKLSIVFLKPVQVRWRLLASRKRIGPINRLLVQIGATCYFRL
jgi:hypothetical protein